MKVYLFNPGHDIALAAHHKYVTLPHAARQLQADLAYLPVLWATDGDFVLVERQGACEHTCAFETICCSDKIH